MHRNPRPSNVEARADDPALTGHAGLLLTGELAARTDLVARLDRAVDAVRPFKQRRRGRSGGELLVALAEAMTAGGDHLVHLDSPRACSGPRPSSPPTGVCGCSPPAPDGAELIHPHVRRHPRAWASSPAPRHGGISVAGPR